MEPWQAAISYASDSAQNAYFPETFAYVLWFSASPAPLNGAGPLNGPGAHTQRRKHYLPIVNR